MILSCSYAFQEDVEICTTRGADVDPYSAPAARALGDL